MLRKNDIVFRQHERARNKLEDIVRAIAQGDLCGRNAVAYRERLLEGETVAVRIACDISERRVRCRERLGARPQRILVTGELDDIAQAKLALELLNRLAGRIGFQRTYAGRRQRGNIGRRTPGGIGRTHHTKARG